MRLFGRRGRAPKPHSPGAPADVDLAERLKDFTVEPAPPRVQGAGGGAEGAGGAALAGDASDPSPPAPDGLASLPPADDLDASAGADAANPAAGDEQDPSAAVPILPAAVLRAAVSERAVPRADHDLVSPPDPHVDRLTNLLGPEIFERLLVAESARSRRYRRPAALVLAELAGLEELTAAWGLDVAVQAVVSLAGVLRAGSRTSDYVGRIATNRFAIILTETDEIAAINYVDRVRDAWEAQPAIAMGALRVGFGWAGTPRRETLVDARPVAEEALQKDLGAGRG